MTEKIQVRLNDNYSNEFTTLYDGTIFYKDPLAHGEKSIWKEVDLNNIQIQLLLKQGTLIPKKEEKEEAPEEKKAQQPEKPKMEEKKKEEEKKESAPVKQEEKKIITDKPSMQGSVKEVVSESNKVSFSENKS